MAIIRKKKQVTESEEVNATDPSLTETEGGNGSGTPGIDSQVSAEGAPADGQVPEVSPAKAEQSSDAEEYVAKTSNPPKKSKKK